MYDDNAPKLIANGYYPLPTAPVGFKPAKSPVRWIPSFNSFQLLQGWSTRPAPIITPQPGANIGVRCGGCLVVLDYDDDDAALKVSESVPSPINKAGKRAFSSFHYADFDVPSEDFFDAAGNKVLQILSTGRQTVIPPSIHPDTGQPYRWTNGHSLYDTPLKALPALPRDYRERIMALGYLPKREPVEEKVNPETGEIGGSDDDWRELNNVALKNLAAWVPGLNLFKCKRRVGRFANYDAVATWRESSTGRPLEQRAPNLRISGLGIKDFGDGRTYTPIDLVMAARNSSAAEAFCWLEEKLLPQKADIEIDLEACKLAQSQVDLDKLAEDAPKTAPEEDGVRVYGRIRLVPYDAIPPEKLKRRMWLYRRHYLGGTVSSTVGDSGIGKTSLSLIEIVGLSIGYDLLGKEKLQPHRCWYHNGEDTRDEINLRLGAICEYYALDQAEVRKHLTITCGLDMPVEVAAGSPPVIDKKLVEDIAAAIIGEGFQVAVFDPLITMHQVNENGVEIRTVLRNVFARVANFTGCAIELPHHTRKLFPGAEEATADDARGSTEIKAAVRGMRMASLMSKAEAELHQISEKDRLSYFKMYSAKANMTKRGNVFWYKIEGHELPNGVPEEGIPGENVGVVTKWEPPSPLDPLTLYTLDDKKFWYELAKNGGHRYDQRALDWFGHKIAERLRLKARTNSEHKRRAAAVLEALIEEGVLAVESCADGASRRKVTWVVAGKPTWVDTIDG